MHLTDQDKLDLIADVNSDNQRLAFEALNIRYNDLTPDEWLEFLTRYSKLFVRNSAQEKIVGDNFLL